MHTSISHLVSCVKFKVLLWLYAKYAMRTHAMRTHNTCACLKSMLTSLTYSHSRAVKYMYVALAMINILHAAPPGRSKWLDSR